MDAGDFDPSLSRQADQVVLDDETRRWLTAALLINSALYLTAAFIAGLILGNRIAWGAALISCGLCYVAPMVQLMSPAVDRSIAVIVVMLSIAFGVLAGVALLFF